MAVPRQRRVDVRPRLIDLTRFDELVVDERQQRRDELLHALQTARARRRRRLRAV